MNRDFLDRVTVTCLDCPRIRFGLFIANTLLYQITILKHILNWGSIPGRGKRFFSSP
jgi:hypothetical protein